MAKRRGNNEGSIWLRADGRWEARITLPDGRRRPYYGKTRREVQTRLAAALRELQQGHPVSPGRQTVGQFLTRWLDEWARPSVRSTTLTSYETLVRVHIVPGLGRVPLAALTADHVQHLLNEKRKAGLTPRRVQMIRAVLRTALNRAVKSRLIAHNVAADTPSPHVPRMEVPVLTPAEAQRLIEGLRGNRLEALYITALGTGLRQGELLGLRWSDIDFRRETLTVRHQLQRIDGQWQLAEPKSARARRTLAVDPLVIGALQDHRARQEEDRLAAGGRWRDPIPDLVFRTSAGAPLNGPTVTHRFQQALERAGLPRIRFHDLRHGAASLLLSQGVHARVVMEQLGHSQISLTMNTYAHVAPELQREAARRLGAALTSPSTNTRSTDADDRGRREPGE